MLEDTSPRNRLRAVVGLTTLAVTGIAAPAALGASAPGGSAQPQAGSSAAAGVAGPTVTRLWGQDRTETAIAVANAAYGNGKPKAAVAVLSRDDNYADALAGNALAAQKKGPLLLTPTAGLDSRVGTALQNDVTPGAVVYILGGTNALSAKVESDVKALGFTPKRLQGPNRFATASAIANEVSAHPHSVLVATAANFPDALAAGAAAAQDPNGGVVVLSDGNTLPPESRSYLAGIDPAKANVYGVGNQGATAIASLPAFAGHVVDFRGFDRFDTARQLAANTTLFPNPANVGLATGYNWADALSGGAYIAAQHGPLLLVDGTRVSDGERQWLQSRAGSIASITEFGGTAVVPDSAGRDAASAATPGGGNAPALTNPVAAITAKVGKGGARVGLPVAFDASASKPGSGAIKSYTFNFGDGTAPVTVLAPKTPTVTHTFTAASVYNVTVTVTDVDGMSAPASLAAFQVLTASGNTGGGVSGSFTSWGGMEIQVGVFDDHHSAGGATRPAWCDINTPLVGNGVTAGPGSLLMFGSADGNGGCGVSGWDTPGVKVTNTSGSVATVSLKSVDVQREAQVSSLQNGITVYTDAGSSGGSWSLWADTITLQPGQAVIFAQTGSNNFDPGDRNFAGVPGADPAMCAAPAQNKPTFTLVVNGTSHTFTDVNQVMNTHGVDGAGCIAPSAGSGTRSNESLPWQAVQV